MRPLSVSSTSSDIHHADTDTEMEDLEGFLLPRQAHHISAEEGPGVYHFMEIFSPFRVAAAIHRLGMRSAGSLDILTGCDLLTVDGRYMALSIMAQKKASIPYDKPAVHHVLRVDDNEVMEPEEDAVDHP